jgi:hypothetical protein
MKDQDDYGFLADIAKEHEAMRAADYSVTPEEAVKLRKLYPMDGSLADGYGKIKPEEFFDGA